MINKLHVGNLAYSVTDEILKAAFEQFGAVQSAVVVRDRISGRSKGFGFVEMVSEEEAAQALEKLNKTELEGRMMFISEAKSTGPFEPGTEAPRSGRPPRGGRRFGGGRGGRPGFGRSGGGRHRRDSDRTGAE